MKLKKVFGDKRIIGLVGEKSSGKTNNLMSLIKDFRKYNESTPIYIFGVNEQTIKWAKEFKNVYEVSSMGQIAKKRDSLLIIDEMQKLKLNNKRYKEILDAFVNFIYHKNNRVILSSPNPREFNSIIGAKIERWALKTVYIDNCVNGSQLKQEINKYNGRFKSLSGIDIEKDKMVIVNDDVEEVVTLDYIEKVDNKRDNEDILKIEKKKKKKKKGKKGKGKK